MAADRSKREARRTETKRNFDEGTLSTGTVIRCRSCKKSHREAAAMVEMGGFIFCNECIELAHSIIQVRKAGG